jgi:hypothetical protein
MRKYILTACLAVLVLAGGTDVLAKGKPSPAAPQQVSCLAPIQGKVNHCYSPFWQGYAELAILEPVAPPMGIVLRYTHLKLHQVMVTRVKYGQKPIAITYLFEQSPAKAEDQSSEDDT